MSKLIVIEPEGLSYDYPSQPTGKLFYVKIRLKATKKGVEVRGYRAFMAHASE